MMRFLVVREMMSLVATMVMISSTEVTVTIVWMVVPEMITYEAMQVMTSFGVGKVTTTWQEGSMAAILISSTLGMGRTSSLTERLKTKMPIRYDSKEQDLKTLTFSVKGKIS